MRALYSAATGMQAQQLNLDVIATNMANVGTTGFKRSRVEFADLLYAELDGVGGNAGSVQVGSGTQVAAIRPVFTSGVLKPSERNLDLAIQGEGLLRLQGPAGRELYTRDGNLRHDAQGQLVAGPGYPVLGVNGPIRLPAGADQVRVIADGTVYYVDTTGQTQAAGQFSLAVFPNPEGLVALGDRLLGPSAAAGVPVAAAPNTGGAGSLIPMALETANVDVLTEMVGMITAQRVYEISSRALRSADEMLGVANQLRR